jgi:phosphoribosylglycinamide formyltransferase 1
MDKKIAILTSGKSRGSNFIQINEYFLRHRLPVKICFVVVTDHAAPVIQKCRDAGVKFIYLPIKDMKYFEDELLVAAKAEDLDLIALAGFLKKLSAEFIHNFAHPILNIHPALLPKCGGKGMYGMKVHERVYKSGDSESGVTIHRVNEKYDCGEIILQEKTSIEDCNSPEEIAAKVLRLEHKYYGLTIWRYLNRQINH